MADRQCVKILFFPWGQCMFFKYFICLIIVFLCACNQEFYTPPPDVDFPSFPQDPQKPWTPPPIDPPISPPSSEMPYGIEDFLNKGFLSHEIIASSGTDIKPEIYENMIAYVENFNSIVLYEITTKNKKMITRKPNSTISKVKIYKNILTWAEKTGKNNYDLYFAFTELPVKEQKIASINSYDASFRTLQIQENIIYWTHNSGDSWNPSIYFYNLTTKITQEIIGIHSDNFKVKNQWLIYKPIEQYPPVGENPQNLYAYNLISGSKMILTSSHYHMGNFFISSNNIVFSTTSNSISIYDLNNNEVREVIFFQTLDNSPTVYSIQDQLLYLNIYGYVYALNLNTFELYYCVSSKNRSRGPDSFHKNTFVDNLDGQIVLVTVNE